MDSFSLVEVNGELIAANAKEKLEFLNGKMKSERAQWFADMAKKTKRDWPWSKPRLYTQAEIKLLWKTEEGYSFAGSPEWRIERRWNGLKEKFEAFIKIGNTANSVDGTGFVYLSFDDYKLLFA